MVDKHLQAVLFDLDGTLINSQVIDSLTFQNVMWNYLHITVDTAGFDRYRGTPVPKIMANFAPKEKVSELVNVWSTYKARFSDKMFLYPGILSLIKELKKAGLKLAVVTSQTEPEINLTRSCLGLDDIFDSWVCSDNVTKAKPDPEPVLTALKQLKVETHRSIMIGDTFNDLEAGRQAGTYIGAVLWGFGNPQQLLSYHPDFVFKTVEDIYTLTQFIEINN